MSDENDNSTEKESLSFWQMLASTAAAAFGVQSSKNRERDFQKGKPIHFIVIGIVFTVLFVMIVAFVVSTVLSGV